MIVDNGKYYLYRHIRLDSGMPFYIGIGTKRCKYKFKTYKSEYHRAFAYKRSDYWKAITNKTGFEIEILIESDDRNFIGSKEKEYVTLYGRTDINTGILCNHSCGGIDKPSFISVRDSRKGIGWNAKKSYLYDGKNGDFISSFDTLQKLCKFTKIKDNRVGDICKNKYNFNGFIYSFEDMGERVNIDMFKKRITNGIAKTVYKFDMDSGELVGEYKSLAEVSKVTPVSFKAIHQAIVNKGNSYGYYWSYSNKINLTEYKKSFNKWQ